MSHHFSYSRERRALLAAGLLACWSGLARSRVPLAAQADPALLPMLARPWQDTLDPVNFFVSEKMDGVRALWDGQSLRFRGGRLIAAPAWFLAALPAAPLDGEL